MEIKLEVRSLVGRSWQRKLVLWTPVLGHSPIAESVLIGFPVSGSVPAVSGLEWGLLSSFSLGWRSSMLI